ncbi:MAG: RNA polymerase sigma factor [Parcubacteria group bacterium]
MPPSGKPVQQGPDIREEQLREWMADYGPALRRYFQKKVGPAEAEDLVQDVFVSLQVRGCAETIDNVEGYLFRVAANALMRRHRRRGWDWAGHEPLVDADYAADDASPERVLMGKEAMSRVVAALADLPPRSSEAFFLHRFEEMTYAAIAARMNISTKAVDHAIQRALKHLSRALEAAR